MKKILNFILPIILFISCSTDRNDEKNETVIYASTTLKINTSNGENFLDSIDPSKISLYYEDNGELKLISYNWDYPRGFDIFQEPPLYTKMIKIFCYIESGKIQDKTFIKWSNNDMDTLSYDIDRSYNNIIIRNIKYNSENITNENQYGIYEIVK